MKNLILVGLLSISTLFATGAITTATSASAADAKEPQVDHCVYFSLTDNSAAAKEKLIAGCKKYLTGHPDIVTMSVGALAKDMKRPINDQEFDVSLHIVFVNKAAHDRYNTSEKHQKLVNENKANLKKVRVFDSYIDP